MSEVGGLDIILEMETPMSSKTHNAKAGREQQGSSSDNLAQQKAASENPGHSNARDSEGRKGGDNAKNL
jgi:hypothetical protein